MSADADFLRMTPDEQRAVLRATAMAVSREDLDAFFDTWQIATQDHGAPYRVVGNLFGAEFSITRNGSIERLLEEGLCVRPATTSERADVEWGIRSGALQIEIRKGVGGLLGPTQIAMVLHQATGRFRPFAYRYQRPHSTGGVFQPCDADIGARLNRTNPTFDKMT